MLRFGLIAALALADGMQIPTPFTSQGASRATLTGPDFCKTNQCVSDAGGGGGGGVSNPYLGTFIADSGVFNQICLQDGGCIVDWPGQVLTGWDGGSIAGLSAGVPLHCVSGSLPSAPGFSFNQSIATSRVFITRWVFCGCSTPNNAVACAAQYPQDAGPIINPDRQRDDSQGRLLLLRALTPIALFLREALMTAIHAVLISLGLALIALAVVVWLRRPRKAGGNFEALIESAIVDQLAHEEEMRKHRFQFRRDQRHRAIIQRVERKLGRQLSGEIHLVLTEKLREREK